MISAKSNNPKYLSVYFYLYIVVVLCITILYISDVSAECITQPAPYNVVNFVMMSTPRFNDFYSSTQKLEFEWDNEITTATPDCHSTQMVMLSCTYDERSGGHTMTVPLYIEIDVDHTTIGIQHRSTSTYSIENMGSNHQYISSCVAHIRADWSWTENLATTSVFQLGTYQAPKVALDTPVTLRSRKDVHRIQCSIINPNGWAFRFQAWFVLSRFRIIEIASGGTSGVYLKYDNEPNFAVRTSSLETDPGVIVLSVTWDAIKEIIVTYLSSLNPNVSKDDIGEILESNSLDVEISVKVDPEEDFPETQAVIIDSIDIPFGPCPEPCYQNATATDVESCGSSSQCVGCPTGSFGIYCQWSIITFEGRFEGIILPPNVFSDADNNTRLLEIVKNIFLEIWDRPHNIIHPEATQEYGQYIPSTMQDYVPQMMVSTSVDQFFINFRLDIYVPVWYLDSRKTVQQVRSVYAAWYAVQNSLSHRVGIIIDRQLVKGTQWGISYPHDVDPTTHIPSISSLHVYPTTFVDEDVDPDSNDTIQCILPWVGESCQINPQDSCNTEHTIPWPYFDPVDKQREMYANNPSIVEICQCRDDWGGDTCQQDVRCQSIAQTTGCTQGGIIRVKINERASNYEDDNDRNSVEYYSNHDTRLSVFDTVINRDNNTLQSSYTCSATCECLGLYSGPFCANCNIKCYHSGSVNYQARCQDPLLYGDSDDDNNTLQLSSSSSSLSSLTTTPISSSISSSSSSSSSSSIPPCICPTNTTGRYCQYMYQTSRIKINNLDIPLWLYDTVLYSKKYPYLSKEEIAVKDPNYIKVDEMITYLTYRMALLMGFITIDSIDNSDLTSLFITNKDVTNKTLYNRFPIQRIYIDIHNIDFNTIYESCYDINQNSYRDVITSVSFTLRIVAGETVSQLNANKELNTMISLWNNIIQRSPSQSTDNPDSPYTIQDVMRSMYKEYNIPSLDRAIFTECGLSDHYDDSDDDIDAEPIELDDTEHSSSDSNSSDGMIYYFNILSISIFILCIFML